MPCGMVENKSDNETDAGRSSWSAPTGRRTDEWSECLVQIGDSNDRAAFTRFFRHFAPLIKAFALAGSSLSAAHADELVQEVMFKVWQKAGDFDPTKASASTWIFTITRNARIDYLRKHNRHDIASQPLEADDIWDESPDNQPFSYLQRKRDKENVDSFLKSLPSEQSRCIEKVYIEGKSHTEIAEELGLPLGTVKSRVRLGLKKLQAQKGQPSN